MRVSLYRLVWVVVAGVCLSQASLAADAGPFQGMLSNMMEAIVTNDRAEFIGSATPQVRSAMTERTWKSLHSSYANALKKGYTLAYFGVVKQQGMEVQIYRLSFASGRDDILVKFVVTNNQVAGIWFH